MTTQVEVNEINGVDLDVLQETVQTIQQDPGQAKCKFRAHNKWLGGSQNRTAVKGFYAAKQEMEHQQTFSFLADEPPMLSGRDEGANPVEYLLTALAGCVTTSIAAHAAVRGIHVEEIESELEGDIDMRGFLGIANDVPKGYTNIRVKFRVKADPENLRKLEELSEFSPVLNTITQGAKVDLQFQQK